MHFNYSKFIQKYFNRALVFGIIRNYSYKENLFDYYNLN